MELNEQLRRFWELESFGIEEKESTLYDQFKTNVSFDGTQYQVVLPWRDHVTTIPDNYELSLRRLKGLLRRLRQNRTLLEDYNKAIVSQLEDGIVEIVSDLTFSDGERVHYLLHHAVIRQDKQTTKLRVVYDASAKSTGPSLNECLHIGPKFNQRIFEILVRFRLHVSAFIADIEKAFLMISVDKRDRDALRFLWVKDIHKDPPEIQVLRFTHVTFGVASSPFLLNATVRNHIEQFQESNPVAVDKLLRSIYVDDVVSGTAEEGKSVQLYEEFRVMLAQGGFNLRKFVCSASSEHESRGELQRVLGVAWDPVQDYMIMDLRNIVAEANLCNPTKRHIVSIASKIYDPIGIVSPVTVKFKMLLQDLHCAKIDWDQEISKHLLDYWSKLIMSIKDSEPVLIRRSYFKPLNIESNVQWRLHGFSDASTRAYAAVVYLERCTGEDREVSFVSSKTRIAPTSAQTIPRLELLGALLLARLISSIQEAFEPEITLLPPVCYSDSQVVIYWVKGQERMWKPFVENRVKEIRDLVPVTCWRHCPGRDNPADIPSRGLKPMELISNALWWYGPSWLTVSDREEVLPGEMPEECIGELRASQCEALGLLVSESVQILYVIDMQRYSSLNKLLRVTAFVLKFISILRERE